MVAAPLCHVGPQPVANIVKMQLCFEGPINNCSSLRQVGAVPAVVVAAEHASRQAPNGWRETSPRPSMDERACQPLPQAILTPPQTLYLIHYHR